jgi:hypothetical protein
MTADHSLQSVLPKIGLEPDVLETQARLPDEPCPIARTQFVWFRVLLLAATRPQYESELITSPPLRVPRPHQMFWAIELLTNRTLPSAIATFTPPGWELEAP